MFDNQELRKLVQKIKYENGCTQKEIADKIGVSPQYLSDVLNGRYAFTDELKKKLYVFNTDVEITRMDHPKSSEKLEDADVPLYDIDAAANLRTLMGDKTANILGRISIPNIPSCDGAVYVRGDSMYPLLKTGDIVAYKMVNDIQSLVDGEMYLVNLEMDGDEYLTVKYVHRSNKGEGWVQLASYNQHHGPMDVRLENIKAIALVKFSVRINTMV
jgi:transcriptional regulator with XRE-family HTH domain